MEANDFLKTLSDDESLYMFLGRLKLDASAYTQDYPEQSKHYCKNLWSGNVKQHITDMKYLYDRTPIKPEWLTADEILDFESKMTELDSNF